jgi:heme/copper-type cytochrome/quinol oxidase subunit 1
VGLGADAPSRAARWQPAVFGAGQFVFALGFALAGAHGSERKVYGAEQAGRGLAESIGLGVMGLGGLVAAAGGLVFLGLVVRRWRAARPLPAPEPRRQSWPVTHTPSNG